MVRSTNAAAARPATMGAARPRGDSREIEVTPVTAHALSLDRLLGELERLVSCESPSTDTAALARSAALVAEIGEGYLGVAPEIIVLDDRPHLRWRFGPSADSRVLVLGHHDTVWPIGTLAEFPFEVREATGEDGSVGQVATGPGSFDMKAGLLQAFAALSLIEDRTGVTVLVTADEELGAPTSRALIESEARAAGATLVFEASADRGAVKTARKGMSRYTVRIRGRAAHAGLEPWKGVNATVEVAAVVLAIAVMSGGPTGTTVTPTLLSSGRSGNTVPDEAVLVVDVRATSAADQQRIFDQLTALLPSIMGAQIEVTQGATHDPLEPQHSSALYAELVAAAESAGLAVPGTASVGGASDGNIAAGVGSLVLDGLGAIGAGAHAPGEYVRLEPMIERTVLVSALIERLLAPARPASPPDSEAADAR